MIAAAVLVRPLKADQALLKKIANPDLIKFISNFRFNITIKRQRSGRFDQINHEKVSTV